MQALYSPVERSSMPPLIPVGVFPSHIIIRSHFKPDSCLRIVTSGCSIIPNVPIQSTLTRIREINDFVSSHENRASMFLMDSCFMLASFDMRDIKPPLFPESSNNITVYGEAITKTLANTMMRIGLLKDLQDFLYITCLEV
jgi:hypothetical protein